MQLLYAVILIYETTEATIAGVFLLPKKDNTTLLTVESLQLLRGGKILITPE